MGKESSSGSSSDSDSSNMGKGKGTYKMKHNGKVSVFQAYLDTLPKGSSGDPVGTPVESHPLYAHSTPAQEILKDIGKDRNWTEEQIESDIKVLLDNRLNTFRDIAELSKDSWKAIPLLPLVKDLLRKAVKGKGMKCNEYILITS